MITRAALRQQFEPEMAVLVQQMVPTLRSGTAYSTDPVRRRPDLVRITATYDEPGPGPLAPIPDVYLVPANCGGTVLTSGGASSAYFSMPSAAIREEGVVGRVLPVTEIAPQLLTLVDRSTVAVAPDPDGFG